MAEKDLTEKILESYNDVFADIINVLLFDGKQVISENELENESPVSMYKATGTLHEEERDLAKFWKDVSIRLALIGAENQSDRDKDISLRVIGYDGAGYRAQLLADAKGEPKAPRYPVITVVLYFGRTRWVKNRSLKEVLSIPDGLEPYVNDYRANIFEISYLTDEQLSLFRSDFRMVAEYFVKSRTNPDYRPSDQEIKHTDAFLKMMAVFTGDRRYEEVRVEMHKGNEEVHNMCEVLDRVEERGRAEGRVEGITEGENKLGKLIIALNKNGRQQDVILASTDAKAREALYREFNIF